VASPIEPWSGDDNVHQTVLVEFEAKQAIGKALVDAVRPDKTQVGLGQTWFQSFPISWNF
jgi:hypothetical protein